MAEADYIIIGGGSAGCVLANRLSERPDRKVLLIEAGPEDREFTIHMPKGFGKTLATDRLTWDYRTINGNAHGELWRAGRVLGGGSSVNGMVYTRGQPQDYDEWEQLGARGWGWSTMGEVFRAMEDHEFGDDGVRGSGGPLHISVARYGSPFSEVFFRACSERGLPVKDELTRSYEEGAGPMNVTLARARRNSSATAFLKPARSRPNLSVKTGFVTERILFEDGRATGVVCRRGEESVTFRAAREIILSAGTVNSARLLLLSGIGPAQQLANLGIDVVSDLPVGEELQDHRCFPLAFRVSDHRYSENRHYSGYRLALSVAKYLLYRGGSLAQAPFSSMAYVKTQESASRPDAEIIAGPFTMAGGEDAMGGVVFDREPGVQLIGMPLRSESRGRVSLASPDPDAAPLIEPRYLSARYDQEVALAAFRYTRNLARQSAFQAIGATELAPSRDCQSDDEILDFIKRYGQPGNHAAGTCAMGTGAKAVVDPELRVRGVDGLRVVDCSIMPTIISGHNNGPAMAIAWRAAMLMEG